MIGNHLNNPWNMYRLYILLIVLLWSTPSVAQEIDFGQYDTARYTLTLDIGLDDFNYGSLPRGTDLEPNTYSVEIQNATEVAIDGISFLDIQVELSVPQGNYLLLDGDPECSDDPECRIPFTLEAAYSNVGAALHTRTQYQMIPVVNNTASVRFPILQRQFLPPGPPPPPPTESSTPLPTETALLWLYGTIQVPDVQAGIYTGQIQIDVTYGLPDSP